MPDERDRRRQHHRRDHHLPHRDPAQIGSRSCPVGCGRRRTDAVAGHPPGRRRHTRGRRPHRHAVSARPPGQQGKTGPRHDDGQHDRPLRPTV